VNLRAVHSHMPEGLSMPTVAADGSLADAEVTVREAHFVDDGEPYETSVYARSALPADETFEGPAIIEQSDTTTVVYPGQRCRTDAFGNLLIETSHAGSA